MCSATLDSCKQACEALGECAELSMTSAGCCFFGRTHCVGTRLPPTTQKYAFQDKEQARGKLYK